MRGLSVCQSVFKYLGDSSLVFNENLHEVGGQESKKSDKAGIFKKILIRGSREIKCQKFGFLDIFCATGH